MDGADQPPGLTRRGRRLMAVRSVVERIFYDLHSWVSRSDMPMQTHAAASTARRSRTRWSLVR